MVEVRGPPGSLAMCIRGVIIPTSNLSAILYKHSTHSLLN